MKIRSLILLVSSLLMCGCEGLSGRSMSDDDNQEYVLLKVNNYPGLLKLYRERLQQKEDPKTRFKVAEYYYILEDYESSRHFLAPLLISNPSTDAYLLDSKNLLELGRVDEALVAIDKAISLSPNNGEAYNIKGVILAEAGYFNEAIDSFNRARETFLADNIVMNNIAMVYILKEDYNKALEYLMPMYLRGDKSPKLIHNLVLCLIKTHDYVRAESIIRDENIPESLEKLIVALGDVQVAIKENKDSPKKSATTTVVSPGATASAQQTGLNAKASSAKTTNADTSAFMLTETNTASSPISNPIATNSTNALNPVVELPTQQAVNAPLAVPDPIAPILPESTNVASAPVVTATNMPETLIVPDAPAPVATSIPATNNKVSNTVSDNKPIANLALDNNSGAKATISDVRMADNAKGSRIVIESNKEIKFTVMTPAMGRQLIIELNNFNLSSLLSNTDLYLRKKHKTIESITFSPPENNKVKMTFQFKRNMRAKVYRMGPEDHYKDRVVIDLFDS